MTGNSKPLEALTKAVRGSNDPGRGVTGDLQQRMRALARKGLVNVDGSNGR